MSEKITVLLDDYVTEKMDKYCGKGKKFRNKTSFVRYATERFIELLEVHYSENKEM
jgi:Arc/MetJ-type ribon-helix-helix transcriptional regulator